MTAVLQMSDFEFDAFTMRICLGSIHKSCDIAQGSRTINNCSTCFASSHLRKNPKFKKDPSISLLTRECIGFRFKI